MTAPCKENTKKGLKRRLTSLTKKQHNRVCSDCPERGPTWASILEIPEKAPLGRKKLVAFICVNCAGGHRTLGTHVSRVKSTTLDEWLEEEVLAAENSGNKKVNLIYEGNLKENPGSEVRAKPIIGAHNASRQRFIKEKYTQLTYYSKPAHYRHVEQERNTALFASISSPGSSASKLMNFLRKDNTNNNLLGLEKSLADGTQTTEAEFSDNQSMFQFGTGDLDQLTVVTDANTIVLGGSSTTRSKKPGIARRSSRGLDRSAEMLPSGSSVGASKALFSNCEPTMREDVRMQKLLAVGHQSFADFGCGDGHNAPRRSIFQQSKSFREIGGKKKGRVSQDDFVLTSPTTPRRRVLVASKSMPSPSKARMSLYSRSGRRSRSKSKDRTDIPGAVERSPSRASSRTGRSRGRSQSARQRASSVDVERKRRQMDKHRGTSRLRSSKSRSPSKNSKSPICSTSRKPRKHSPSSPSQSRSRSPCKRHEARSRSPSKQSSRAETKRRSKSSSKYCEKNAADHDSTMVRSTRRNKPKERRLRRARSEQGQLSFTGVEMQNETKAKVTEQTQGQTSEPKSNDEENTETQAKREHNNDEVVTTEKKSRRRHSRGHQNGQEDRKRRTHRFEDEANSSFIIREKGSRRSALERKKNRKGTDDMVASSRALSADGATSRKKEDTNDVVQNDSGNQKSNTRSLSFDGSISQLSQSLVFLYSGEADSTSDIDDKSTKEQNDQIGATNSESLRVIGHRSAQEFARPRELTSYSATSKLSPSDKRRKSRSQLAELRAKRSSRKMDIMASLDRENAIVAGRRPLSRAQSGKLPHISRPIARQVPSRSRSAISLKGVAPKCRESIKTTPTDDSKAAAQSLEDFDRSFSIFELAVEA